eukprot:CAMPEP_0197246260 /NCGR_PEP_ID=MMETSP1429-20130617/10767_1 /TAXON_ID=49237 /ORGANISM="Chaetoceros  sp., Strain UNC1202" /LENGTH=163 /DNA_ID=CAMNT_0042706879 /DNA_START=12 /DNA_END=503 /DNA_ORIENTATION=+
MSSAEREAALRDANEKMRQYYVNRPPMHVVKKKRKFGEGPQDGAHFVQLAAVSSFLCAFLITPFLGRKIARDEEFRKKFIPSWYDFTIEKPDYAWTRQELHEQMIQLQNELHDRAINGEFTPEKLEEMRRQFHGKEQSEDASRSGWDQLHPGVDDDEDIEEDD